MRLWTYVIGILQVCWVVTALGDIYAKDPNIYELTPSNFDKVVHRSNYTTMVKFYAPWCGYCKQITNVYKKLGKLVHKDAKTAVSIAAVNCDKEYNKPLCAKYQIQGFPTIMVFRPAKYTGKPTKKGNHASEVYNGERSLKAMSTFLNSRLKNYVKKFTSPTSDSLSEWLEGNKPKFLLVSSNQQISPLLKSLAIDFLGVAKIGMLHTKKAVSSFKVDADNTAELDEGVTSAFLYFDDEKKAFVKYDLTEKLNDKSKISEWMIQLTGIEPIEGPFSKKDKKYYSHYRKGTKPKKTVEHDEL